MNRHKSETALAWWTLFAATVHFTLETWYHVKWGQPTQALIVDYICNFLMFFGAWASLRYRPGSAIGLLTAAWGFALGFGWRSVFGRLELLQAEQAMDNGEAGFVLPLIAVSLFTVFLTLCWSLWLAWLQARNSHSTGA